MTMTDRSTTTTALETDEAPVAATAEDRAPLTRDMFPPRRKHRRPFADQRLLELERSRQLSRDTRG